MTDHSDALATPYDEQVSNPLDLDFAPGSGPFLETHSGIAFHLLAPRPSEVSIDDIAHALSLQCRYNGHTKSFYSVAEHCVHMAHHALGQGAYAQDALDALMHDATECYIGDMVKPLKNLFPDFERLEARIYQVIAKKFALNPRVPKTVKWYDLGMLHVERAQALNPSENDWNLPEGPDMQVHIEGWGPAVAKRQFLNTFHALDDERLK